MTGKQFELNETNKTNSFYLVYKKDRNFCFKSKDELSTLHIVPHYREEDQILRTRFYVFVTSFIDKQKYVSSDILSVSEIKDMYGIDVDDDCFNVDEQMQQNEDYINYINILQSKESYRKLSECKNFDEFKAKLDEILGWNIGKCNNFYAELYCTIENEYGFNNTVDKGLSNLFGYYYGGE